MSLVSRYCSRLARRSIAVCVVLALLAPLPGAAQGDLLIAPTRLVLDGRRGGEVILSNIGSEEAVYRVGLELRRMADNGYIEAVPEGEANALESAALDMIRYAPRRVTLPPNQPQSIRISARPGAELPDGEYRVHMTFNAVPRPRPVSEQDAAGAGGGIAINLTPIYGITMPIIVRKGQLEVAAGLANPRIERTEDGTAFAIDIARAGAASLYGDLVVTRPGNDDEPLFIARGLGVYPEIETRHSVFSIPEEQAAAMRGPVHIEFREPSERGGGLITALDAELR